MSKEAWWTGLWYPWRVCVKIIGFYGKAGRQKSYHEELWIHWCELNCNKFGTKNIFEQCNGPILLVRSWIGSSAFWPGFNVHAQRVLILYFCFFFKDNKPHNVQTGFCVKELGGGTIWWSVLPRPWRSPKKIDLNCSTLHLPPNKRKFRFIDKW